MTGLPPEGRCPECGRQYWLNEHRPRTLSGSPHDWPDPTLPPGIVSLPMTPMPRISSDMTWIYTGLLVLLFMPTIIEWMGKSNFRGYVSWWMLSSMLFLILMLWILTGVGRYWAKQIMDHEFRSTRWGAMLLALKRARLPLRRSGQKKGSYVIRRLNLLFQEAELDRPRSIVDLRFATSINSIELQTQMIEPEPIFAGPAKRNRDRIFAFIVGGLFLINGLLFGAMFCTIVGVALLIIPIISLQIVRRHSGILRVGVHGLVTGQGFIRSVKRDAWSSDDSICIVRALNRRSRSDDACIVMLYGPDGIRRIPFPSTLDPHFISFWTRWNHPDPRPSLARQSSDATQ